MVSGKALDDTACKLDFKVKDQIVGVEEKVARLSMTWKWEYVGDV